MLLREMMTGNVPLLKIGDTMEKGVGMLRQTKLDGLPVVDQTGSLVGIFTKANLMDAFLLGAKLAELIDNYFTANAITVRDDTSYAEVEGIVKNSTVGTGVVVNEQQEVQGIFSKVDMIMALFKEAEKLSSQLQTVYHSMHNGAIFVDKNQRIQMINSAGEKMLGMERQKLLGCLFNNVFPSIELRPALKEGEVTVGVKERMNNVQVICNINPVFQEGKAAGAVLIFQALTDLDHVALELESTKRLYETLFTVLNIAFEAIIVVDDMGIITMANEAACQFFQKKEEEMLRQPVDMIIENTRLMRVLRTGVAEINDIQIIAGRPYIVSRMPIIRDGKIIGAVGKIVFRKLEEVKELAESLVILDQELSYYRECAGENQKKLTFDKIVTVNTEMRHLKQEAEIAARGISTVLLTGESGTGKELFAQAIHQASPRRKGPFVKVNCAAVPDNLLESEFFGYAPGAFTGARKDGKEGKFAAAQGGTLFLDEIGDMSLNLQGKLLRVLQDKNFEAVGSNKTIKADVRIIAATNQDLLQKVASGDFRQDLYYRLNVINFKLVALRYRKEDIIPLIHVFLEKFNKSFGTNISELAPEVEKILNSYHWPGNVRELENVIERAVNFSTGRQLTRVSLPFYLREQQENPHKLQPTVEDDFGEGRRRSLNRELIIKVLKDVRGNKSEAARVLGISRSWLYEKIRKYNLS